MTFVIKQNNTSPSLLANLYDADGVAVNLQGAEVYLRMKSLNTGIVVTKEATVLPNNSVLYDWVVGDTANPGLYVCDFHVTYVDGATETFPNEGTFPVNITPSL